MQLSSTPQSSAQANTVRAGLRRAGLVGLSLAVGASTMMFAPTSAAIAEETSIPEDASMSELGARFTLGVLPDTQFYSRYSTEETGNQYQATYGSEPYASFRTKFGQKHTNTSSR